MQELIQILSPAENKNDFVGFLDLEALAVVLISTILCGFHGVSRQLFPQNALCPIIRESCSPIRCMSQKLQ